MSRTTANLLLLFAGAVWGMGFVAQATAMEHIGPFLFVSLRFAVATLVLIPFAIRESRRQAAGTSAAAGAGVSRTELGHFVLIGLALFGGMATQQVGLLTTTVTNSGFLTGLYVVFTPVIAVILFRQWPHRIVWPAALLALLGIGLLSDGSVQGLVVGDLLTIGSAGFWALQVVLIGRYVISSGRPMLLSLTQFGVTALLAGVVALFREPFVLDGVRAALPSILYAGVFASGLAFTLQVIGQRYTTAPQAAIFLSSEAPFAALFGHLFLAERISTSGMSGCLIILGAMLLVELVPMLGKRRTAAS